MAIHNLFKNQELNKYIQEISLREPAILKEVREKTESHPCAKMQIPPDEGQFLALLVKLFNVKKALEIGVFTGYSSLSTALAMPDDGHLFALDQNAEWTSRAKKFWQQAKVDHKITLMLDDAVNSLDKLLSENHAETFDFIFIDADKKNYENYYEASLKLLRQGGLMIVDNILWRGHVVNPEKTDPPTETIRAFNKKLQKDDRVDLSLLPLWDGICLIMKK